MDPLDKESDPSVERPRLEQWVDRILSQWSVWMDGYIANALPTEYFPRQTIQRVVAHLVLRCCAVATAFLVFLLVPLLTGLLAGPATGLCCESVTVSLGWTGTTLVYFGLGVSVLLVLVGVVIVGACCVLFAQRSIREWHRIGAGLPPPECSATANV